VAALHPAAHCRGTAVVLLAMLAAELGGGVHLPVRQHFNHTK
jgi:hypothetical protein